MKSFIDTVVVLIEGGVPATAVAPIEILSSAGFLWHELRGERQHDHRFQVRTVSLKGDPVRTIVPLTLTPDGSIEDVESADLIIISAGSGHLETEINRNASLIPWLIEMRENGTAIAGVCAGVLLLAEAGLLDGRPATTHWALVDACRQRYPNVYWQPERFVTESDNIFCSGGVYSAVDLSLYLIEKYCGHQVAMHTAKAMVLQTPRIWQAGYSAEMPQITHDDEQIRKAQEWLFNNFTNEISMMDLADSLNIGQRSFTRRFKAATGDTPVRYLQRLRINAAKHLIENDLKSVREISWAVGYEDLNFFSSLFKRHTGMTPRGYRERFALSARKNIAIGSRTSHQ